MPKYLIERHIPGADNLTAEQLNAISQASCDVLRKLGSEIQWIESFVAVDKIYCIYRAPDEKLIREHAQLGGFPASLVSEISAIIDPTTAED
jgi:Nickel responsive protein SCO4226-like